MSHCRSLRFAPLTLALVLAGLSGVSQANTNSLRLDTTLNVLAFGNFSAPSSDVEGRVAVGGNATLGSYSINDKGIALSSSPALTVGGNLSYSSGRIYGNAVVGGNYNSNSSGSIDGNLAIGGTLNATNGVSASSVTTWGTVTGYQPWYPSRTTGSGTFSTGVDFVGEQARLTQLSSTLNATANTGSVTDSWGTVVFNASNANGLNIFDIQASDASKNMQITGLGSSGTVIINVLGSSVSFGSHGYTNFDTARGRVLFNLPEATTVNLSYVEGSILAPQASITGNWGVVWGQVVTNNWSGPTQINNAPFVGSLPVPAVPEPEAYAMLLAGLGLLRLVARRKDRASA